MLTRKNQALTLNSQGFICHVLLTGVRFRLPSVILIVAISKAFELEFVAGETLFVILVSSNFHRARNPEPTR